MSSPTGFAAESITVAVSAIAAADDVMTRKVHNVLLAAMAPLSLGLMFYFYGLGALESGLVGLLTGIALYFPLAWFGVVGGGDLKLIAVVGLSSGLPGTLVIGVLALIWASLLGMLQVIFQGQLANLAKNLATIATLKKPQDKQLHKIPYAAAILLAALTHWILMGHGKPWGGLP